MAYRLKQVQYKKKDYHILLQNENGPCPLLAAANSLLLKGSIELPSHCIGSNVVTIDQLVNVLAETILSTNNAPGNDHHIQEVLTVFPSLQYGMDVNPKFTSGPNGVEYTMQLNAFDLLRVELVHGWLLEPDAEEYDLVSNLSYNQLINIVIEGNDAGDQLQRNPHSSNANQLSEKATKGTLVKHFLDRSAHQLTQYGLTVLHETLKNDQIVVFFRNNHFNTLCKHKGLLYLLVTDLGYADVGSVVWEKLDVIDGDTEYVTGDFVRPPPIEHHQPSNAATGEHLLANNMQSQADYQLALQLSRENTPQRSQGANNNSNNNNNNRRQSHDSQLEAAMQASLLHHSTSMPIQSTTTTGGGGGGTIAAIPPAQQPTTTSTTTTTAAATAASSSIPVVASATLSPNSPPRISNLATATATAAAGRGGIASAPAPGPPLSTTANNNNNPSRTPPPAATTTSATTRTGADPNTPTPNVAVGIPTRAPTQEELDHRMAMQIQRQEEQERAQRLQDERYSTGLATAYHRREKHVQRTRVGRPGPPPRRQPTAPNSAGGESGGSGGGGDKSNCIIS